MVTPTSDSHVSFMLWLQVNYIPCLNRPEGKRGYVFGPASSQVAYPINLYTVNQKDNETFHPHRRSVVTICRMMVVRLSGQLSLWLSYMHLAADAKVYCS